jgi:hypothetical protein
MSAKLHITNGTHLSEYLTDLGFSEPILTWQEMLCEGPTIAAINSEEFFKLRKIFLNDYYDIVVDEQDLAKELHKLDSPTAYNEIILWFEYDLFCHINMLGVINLIHQKEIKSKLSLVCSGRVHGEKDLKGLSELNQNQLLAHYEHRIELTPNDKELAIALWRTYCGSDHNILKPYITKASSFEYMGNCLKAHLQRFPDQKSGLSALETNILKLIRDYKIKSVHHLLGYALNYQGYYGFGDIQMQRIIKHLQPLYSISQNGLSLNREGYDALLGHSNAAQTVNNQMIYGGVNRMDFVFSEAQNKLMKKVINAH